MRRRRPDNVLPASCVILRVSDLSLEPVLRRALLAILAMGLLGTGVELLLLKHTDGAWQLVPVVLTGAATAVTAWCALRPGIAALRALRGLMLLCVAAGVVGIVQHFRGNVAYARDANPSLDGAALYWEALMGATPSLAPGAMIQLGLVGLLFAFRHPAARATTRGVTDPGDAIR